MKTKISRFSDLQQCILNERVNTEVVAHPANVFRNILFFNKVVGLQFSCEYSKIFKNSFFHKTPPVAATEKLINFP